MKQRFRHEPDARRFAERVAPLCLTPPIVHAVACQDRKTGVGWQEWCVTYERADQLELPAIGAEEVTRGHA